MSNNNNVKFLNPKTQNKSSAVAEIGDHLGTIDIGRKEGGVAMPLLGINWIPINATWPGPRYTSVQSAILIDPAIWPQQTWAKNWGLCPF